MSVAWRRKGKGMKQDGVHVATPAGVRGVGRRGEVRIPGAREIVERLEELRKHLTPRPTNSRCVKIKDEYGNIRSKVVIDDNDKVLLKVNIPRYIKFYPYRLDRVFYVLESGKIIKWFNLDNGESFCEDVTIDELLEELKEAKTVESL